MKKVTLFFITVISVLSMSSCGGDSNAKKSDKKDEAVAKTEQAEQNQEAEKEENTYVKDKYLKDMNLTTTTDKYSTEYWSKVSNLSKAIEEFDKIHKPATKEDITTFFKQQGFDDFESGKDFVLEVSKLYTEVAYGLPVNFGSLGTIKEIYGNEKYKEDLKNMSDEYNELGLSGNDLKNIEMHSDDIGEVLGMKISIEYAK